MRRVFDLSVAIPAVVLTTPVICALAVAKKLEDGGSMFFYQERLSQTGDPDLHLIKIRCMKEGSDIGAASIGIAQGKPASADPRNTRLGAFMHKYQLEELPQLYQVIQGQMSIVGIRPLPQYVFDYVQTAWDAETYDTWVRAYQSGRSGITGLNQALNMNEKDDRRRQHFDIFYARHASLELDLYILWRTLGRLMPSIR